MILFLIDVTIGFILDFLNIRRETTVLVRQSHLVGLPHEELPKGFPRLERVAGSNTSLEILGLLCTSIGYTNNNQIRFSYKNR